MKRRWIDSAFRKTVTTLFAFTVIVFAGTAACAQMPDARATRDTVNWPGYYTATLPAASSPGIETTLILQNMNGETRYILIENFLEEKDGTFRSSGPGKWDASGRSITLAGPDESRVVFVGEGWVQFLGADETVGSETSQYALRRMDVFTGSDRTLLVDPAAVRTEERGGRKVVVFPGIITFNKNTAGGYRSLKADFEMDCAVRRHTMSRIRYFDLGYGTGRIIGESAMKGGRAMPILAADKDVIYQAWGRYCSR